MEESQQMESPEHPHVSVVLVNYNTRELTLDAIGSVFESVREPSSFRVEVIVVDNASADGSADAFELRFPQICVVRSSDNLGYGRGNNVGAEHATGDALFLLNTDTVVRPGAIETLYGSLFADDHRGVVGPFLENPDGSYQTSMISFPTVWRTFCAFFLLDRLFSRSRLFADASMSYANPMDERNVDVIHGAAMMIRRDLFERINGFDPEYFMYFEESDLCKRVESVGFSARYIPSAHVLHLISQSSKTHPWWFYRILRQSRMIYARKHMSTPSRLSIAMIVHVAYAIRITLYPLLGLFKPKFRIKGLDMLKSYLRVESPFSPRKNVNA